MPATPPPGYDPALSVLPDTEERVGMGLGGFIAGGTGLNFDNTPLAQSLAEHMARRQNEARLHYGTAGAIASTLASGVDPNTGQPLTQADRQRLTHQWEAEYQAYAGIVGVNKEAKGKLSRAKNVIEHLIGRSSPQQTQQGAAAASPTGSTAAAPPPKDLQGIVDVSGGVKQPAPPNPGGIPTPPPGMSPQDAMALTEMEQPFNQAELNARLQEQVYEAREAPQLEMDEERIQEQLLRDQATDQYRKASLAATQADRAARLAQTAQTEADRRRYQQEEIDSRKQAQTSADAYRKLSLQLREYTATHKKTGTGSKTNLDKALASAEQTKGEKLAALAAAQKGKTPLSPRQYAQAQLQILEAYKNVLKRYGQKITLDAGTAQIIRNAFGGNLDEAKRYAKQQGWE